MSREAETGIRFQDTSSVDERFWKKDRAAGSGWANADEEGRPFREGKRQGFHGRHRTETGPCPLFLRIGRIPGFSFRKREKGKTSGLLCCRDRHRLIQCRVSGRRYGRYQRGRSCRFVHRNRRIAPAEWIKVVSGGASREKTD